MLVYVSKNIIKIMESNQPTYSELDPIVDIMVPVFV